jgi:hypothetical protein
MPCPTKIYGESRSIPRRVCTSIRPHPKGGMLLDTLQNANSNPFSQQNYCMLPIKPKQLRFGRYFRPRGDLSCAA